MEKAPGGGSRLRVWGTPLARGGAFFLGALDRRRTLVCSPPDGASSKKREAGRRQGGDREETERRRRGRDGASGRGGGGAAGAGGSVVEVSRRCRASVAPPQTSAQQMIHPCGCLFTATAVKRRRPRLHPSPPVGATSTYTKRKCLGSV